MPRKFRAGNSGFYIGKGTHRVGRYWVDDAGVWKSDDCAKDIPPWALLKHLGMVRVDISESQGVFRVVLDVRAACAKAIVEVLDFLDFFRCGRVVDLEFNCDGWVKERWASELEAIFRIEKVMMFQTKKKVDPVMMMSFEDPLMSAASSVIQQGFKAWEECDGNIEHEAIKRFLPRMLIYQRRAKDNQLMALSRGTQAAFNKVLPGWGDGSSAPAFDFEYPSKYYNDRMTEAYDRVLEDGEICFNHIRATMPRPDGEAAWVPYQRLLLPLLLADGSRALGCLSHLSSYNEIPFLESG